MKSDQKPKKQPTKSHQATRVRRTKHEGESAKEGDKHWSKPTTLSGSSSEQDSSCLAFVNLLKGKDKTRSWKNERKRQKIKETKYKIEEDSSWFFVVLLSCWNNEFCVVVSRTRAQHTEESVYNLTTFSRERKKEKMHCVLCICNQWKKATRQKKLQNDSHISAVDDRPCVQVQKK